MDDHHTRVTTHVVDFVALGPGPKWVANAKAIVPIAMHATERWRRRRRLMVVGVMRGATRVLSGENGDDGVVALVFEG